MFQPDEQERAKFAALRVSHAQMFAFQEPGEELLGQILSVVRIMRLPPDEGVEGIPIGAAQLLQRRLRSGCRTVTGGHDHAPMGGSKLGRGRWKKVTVMDIL